MGSLHDQLLKVGLVDEDRIKKAKIDKRKQERRQRKGKKEARKPNKPQLRTPQVEKVERDRELNRQRQKRAERKAIAAQIKQLVEKHRQPIGDGDVPFNFAHNKKIKRIYITEAVRELLIAGKLSIVKLDGRYELIPSTIMEKIRIRDEKYVIFCNEPKKKNAEKTDDPYADYQIPDDLVW